jgi:hypothetical protein
MFVMNQLCFRRVADEKSQNSNLVRSISAILVRSCCFYLYLSLRKLLYNTRPTRMWQYTTHCLAICKFRTIKCGWAFFHKILFLNDHGRPTSRSEGFWTYSLEFLYYVRCYMYSSCGHYNVKRLHEIPPNGFIRLLCCMNRTKSMHTVCELADGGSKVGSIKWEL